MIKSLVIKIMNILQIARLTHPPIFATLLLFLNILTLNYI